MRVLYYAQYDRRTGDGVVKKIVSQAKSWRRFSIDCLVLWHFPGGASDDSEVSVEYSRIKFPFKTLREILRFEPALVYVRYASLNPLLLFLLFRYKCIFEVNGLAHEEVLSSQRRSFFQLIRYFWHRFSFFIITRSVVGVVCPTSELSQIFREGSALVVPNSIDIEAFPVIKRAEGVGRIALFFMGTGGFDWHGVDYIEILASRLPEFDFHVIGEDGTSTENLFYHGWMSRLEYREILKRCHICIGTLALHRRGLREAAPLKTREYIASGFPIIVNYQDTPEILARKWCLDLGGLSIFDSEEVVSIVRDFCFEFRDFILDDEQRCLVASDNIERARSDLFRKLASG